MTKNCIICGNKFDTNRPDRLCCSKKCNLKYRNNYARQYMQNKRGKKFCAICGKEITKRWHKKLCGNPECERQQKSNYRKKHYLQARKQKRLTCIICGKEITKRWYYKTCGSPECQRKNVRNHIKKYRLQKKPVNYCSICSEKITKPYHYKTCGKPECKRLHQLNTISQRYFKTKQRKRYSSKICGNPSVDLIHYPIKRLQLRLDTRVYLQKHLDKLTLREKYVIEMRFGLNEEQFLSLAEIGKKVKLSRERVRQIEQIALNKLKHLIFINEKAGSTCQQCKG